MIRFVKIACLLCLFSCPGALWAQEFVVFKVHTPFDMGGVVPDSGRVSHFYVKIG